MQKITPFLWFNEQAEEAASFYVSIFKSSKIVSTMRYGEGSRGPTGSVMTVTFELDGEEFIALNGGPYFTLSPAISFFIQCETQEEVDHFWEKLSEGGKRMQCGWVTDRFGVTWQVAPTIMGRMLQDKDAEKSNRVMKAMLQMEKPDIKRLTDAYEGR